MKALNTEMVFALAEQLGISDTAKLKADMVEALINASRYEEAGDLVDPLSDFETALDCYLKANKFEKAIKLCLQSKQTEQLALQVKPSLLVS